MNYLEAISQKITNTKLAFLMQSYKKFILDSIKKKNVLGKKFYLIIPFSPLELGVTKSLLTTAKRKGPLPFPESYVLKKAKVVLYPRRDHLVRQAGRLGLKLKQLTNLGLMDLFYDVYNTEAPAIKKEEGSSAIK